MAPGMGPAGASQGSLPEGGGARLKEVLKRRWVLKEGGLVSQGCCDKYPHWMV